LAKLLVTLKVQNGQENKEVAVEIPEVTPKPETSPMPEVTPKPETTEHKDVQEEKNEAGKT
jgi:hypothetical protein